MVAVSVAGSGFGLLWTVALLLPPTLRGAEQQSVRGSRRSVLPGRCVQQ